MTTAAAVARPAQWSPAQWSAAQWRALAARVSPRVTPLTTGTVALLAGVAVVLRVWPEDVADIVAWTSTNVANLTTHPVAAMLTSAFVVPEGLLPELILVAVGFARLERSIGTLRTAAVALSAHVLATLLTEYGAYLLTKSPADRPDVGVSYAMFGVLAALSLRLKGRARILAGTAIAAAVVIPVAVAPGMTTTGHLLSVVIGALAATLLRRRPGDVPAISRQGHRQVGPGPVSTGVTAHDTK
jgi:hypothetical protein